MNAACVSSISATSPVGLGVALGPIRRLLPGVGLAPALLGLRLVLVRETVAEELLRLLWRGWLVLISLQCSIDGCDELLRLVETGQDRFALAAQVRLRVVPAVEQGRDLLQRRSRRR